MEGPFTCDICYKSFTRADNLKRHENQCIYGRQIVCQYCESTFTRYDSLNRHIRDTHNMPITTVQKINRAREIMDMPCRQETEKLDANILISQFREYVLQGSGIKEPGCVTILKHLRDMKIIE